MEIGLINKLKVDSVTDTGYYLVDDDNNKILLPNTSLSKDYNVGDELNAFVYKDLDDRTMATTVEPSILLDHFAFLKVAEVR